MLLAKAVQHCAIPGLYSGIFSMYLQHRSGSQQNTDRANNILFYALWVLYALSVATSIIDILGFFWIDPVSMDNHHCLTLCELVVQNNEMEYHLAIIQATIFALCEVIAQFILVRTTGNTYHLSNFSKDISLLDYLGLQHSCCDHSIIISIRILTYINLHSPTHDFNLWFLAIWIMGGTAPLSAVQAQYYSPRSNTLAIAGLPLSMTVNALVTGLIVFKIFKVFKEVKTGTADDESFGVTGGNTFQRVIFIIIESAMVLFSIQLTRLVAALVTTDAANNAYHLITGIHQMLIVIMTINDCYVILLIT